MTTADFIRVVATLGEQGAQDIAWAEGIKPPTDPEAFAREAIFVICNSGMKNTVARGIYNRCITALAEGRSASAVFKHAGKCGAMDDIWRRRAELLADYTAAEDKLAFCADLPWIGPITKYHLAKNFGVDVVKPDRHLVRIAIKYQTTPDDLCRRIAEDTGYRVATVDTILWRACANGLINSRTGEIKITTITTSEVFRDYLGMTPESAPWAFGRNIFCMKCDGYVGRASSPYCKKCGAIGYVEERSYLTATSPLAPAPNPAWLYELVGCESFRQMTKFPGKFDVISGDYILGGRADNPIHAVCRALIAADPDLRARLEACEDWKEVQA